MSKSTADCPLSSSAVNAKVLAAGGYASTLTYTKNVDPAAAAKTKATAVQLVLGTASPGLFMAGYKAATLTDADYDRYFKIDLTAGTATVKLENVASDLFSQFQVIDSANAVVATIPAPNLGANPPSTPAVSIPTTGTYYIVPGIYAGGRPKAAGQGPKKSSRFKIESLNHYHEDFFVYEPGGTKNLDMILSDCQVDLGFGELQAAHLQGDPRLDVLNTPWGESGYGPMRAVDGELDNVYSRSKSPLKLQ